MAIKNSRVIQYYGLYKFTEEEKKAKSIYLRFSLIRPPIKSISLNTKSNPPESFYGYITFFRGKHFERKIPIDFQRQIILQTYNNASWQFLLQRCHLEADNYSFARLGEALQLLPVTLPIPFKDWKLPVLTYDGIAVKMLDQNCIAEIECFREDNDSCGLGDNFTNQPATPDDEPPQQIAVDAIYPGQIAPPYVGIDDDGFTYVVVNPEYDLPFGSNCDYYRVVFRVGYSETDWQPVTRNIFAPLVSVDTGIESGTGWGFTCHGIDETGCLENPQFFPTGSPYPYVDIDSITPL